MPSIAIRNRTVADVDALTRLVEAVHAIDGYPPYLPEGGPGAFVLSGEPLAAWVAVDGDAVVGHIALHDHSSPGVFELVADRLGVDRAECGVVARLFVAPDRRSVGLGARLLGVAVADCGRRGLLPVLDVVDRFEAARALYERSGWRRLGAVEFDLPDGSRLREFVYVSESQA